MTKSADRMNNRLSDRINDRLANICKTAMVQSKGFPYDFLTSGDFRERLIEYDEAGTITLVTTENGKVTERLQSQDVEDIVYWIFAGRARDRAHEYERRNRHPSHDPRRMRFAHALDEISRFSPEWRDRLEREQQEKLARTPFRDQG